MRAVLARLEEEDRVEREAGLPSAQRSRQVARSTGQFLFSFVAAQTDCEVLEIGGSRGYSTIWLTAGVRHLAGRVLSLEHDPAKCEAWRANLAEAGLDDTANLIEGDAFQTLPEIDDVFDVEGDPDAVELVRSAAGATTRRRWQRSRACTSRSSRCAAAPASRSRTPRADPAGPWRPPTSRPATTASRSCSTRPTGATATRSSTAPTAARG